MSEENEATFEGRCTCGEVRYRMTSRPMFVNCCHCRWCQRETGSSYVINAVIESDRVVHHQGEPEIVTIPSASGKGQKVARCPTCSIALWSYYAGSGERLRYVRVGTLEEPDRLPPDAHVFTASKQPWVVLPEGMPAFEEFYSRTALWPEESQARRRAALG